MHAPARRLALATRRRGEAGVSIVLAMLVLFVLIVVITELRFDASVELDQSRATAEGARMRMVAEAAFLQARTSLLMDAEAAAGDEAGGEGGDGNDPLGDLMTDPQDADDGSSPEDNSDDGTSGLLSGEGTGGDVSDVIARTDSLLDDWHDSVAMQPPVGNDFTLWVEVVDEDGKLNLLGLWTADPLQRDAWRDVLRELLDDAFDDSSFDLSFTDATKVLENLDDWVKGQRGTFDPVPVPPIKRSNAEDEALASGASDASFTEEEPHEFPLTLGELLLVGGLKPEHLSGFVEDDHWYPGLEEYLTLWSQLELKPEPPKSDEFDGSPFTQGSLFDQSLSEAGGGLTTDEEDGADDAVAENTPTNDGLVNVNTAPLKVLRALAPEDMPTTFLERLVEFRERIVDLRKEGKIYGTGSLFDDPVAGSGSGDDESAQDGGTSTFGEDDDEDPTKYVFETTDEIIPKVEEEFGIELAVDPDVESLFVSRLGVTSQVFTIKVLLLEQKTGRRASYRGLVWRMLGGEEPLALTLVPLEPFYDSRRLKDFPEDIGEQSEARFDRWTPEGYVDPNRPQEPR